MPDARPIVTILGTGGTISTVVGDQGRSAATLSAGDLTASAGLAESTSADVRIMTRDIDRRPSWMLTPTDMATIATTARDAARAGDSAGIVVTHGTTTLEYTAFLCDLVLDVETPVVLTGAMRRADDAEPDGPRNLADAVRVAADPSARGLGALVVFDGRILGAGSVWKAQRTRTDAFVDLAGDVGRVHASVSIDRRPARRPTFSGELETRVGFVKATPGAGPEVLEAAAGPAARGLVVEALPGTGGVPPRMVTALARAAERMPVVVAARSPWGTQPETPTGGTSEPLAGLGLLSAGSLTAEQAWLLLMAALADSRTEAELRDRYRAAAEPRPS